MDKIEEDMQPDPDIPRGQGVNVPPEVQNTAPVYPSEGIFYNGAYEQPGSYSAVGTGGPKATAGIMMMAVFSGLNLVFLLLAALYSTGFLLNDSGPLDKASFFIMVLMTLIAGGLALFASYVGMRLSRQAGSAEFLLMHKLMFVSVIVLSLTVMVGPLFNK